MRRIVFALVVSFWSSGCVTSAEHSALVSAAEKHQAYTRRIISGYTWASEQAHHDYEAEDAEFAAAIEAAKKGKSAAGAAK